MIEVSFTVRAKTVCMQGWWVPFIVGVGRKVHGMDKVYIAHTVTVVMDTHMRWRLLSIHV
jgi:hypothetical protein